MQSMGSAGKERQERDRHRCLTAMAVAIAIGSVSQTTAIRYGIASVQTEDALPERQPSPVTLGQRLQVALVPARPLLSRTRRALRALLARDQLGS